MSYRQYKYGDVQRYLDKKGVDYTIRGDELLVDCFFGDCDSDSHPNEHHLSFNNRTGQYHCFKCGAKGNLITLKRHFGDIRR